MAADEIDENWRLKPQIVSVSELNRRARGLLEANFELLWVSGELSNVVRAPSGHWYFSLKDASAQVRCVMFRNRAAAVPFTPENGTQIEVRALPTLYEARGDFQLGVEAMRRAGVGTLFEAFERLKARLQAEGLFDEAKKRTIPAFPKRIGIVTSLKAAALKDVLTTLARRAPMIEIIIYPTAVQGATAASEISASIDSARMRNEVDTLIICRGGGSIEDLWCFNDEGLARSIMRVRDETNIVVISGVGHETDFTICDFVADHRAATPTGAAEMASPDSAALGASVLALASRHRRATEYTLSNARQGIDHAARLLISPSTRIANERNLLALRRSRLAHSISRALELSRSNVSAVERRMHESKPDLNWYRQSIANCQTSLKLATENIVDKNKISLDLHRQALGHLNPDNVLKRGYGLVTHRNLILRNAAKVRAGDEVHIRLAIGSVDAEVKQTH